MQLQGELEVMPVNYVSILGMVHLFVPISKSMFKISAENACDIQLEYVDIEEIEKLGEIGDVDGDGISVNYDAYISDFYGGSIDITDKLLDPADELIDMSLVRVKPGIYNKGEPVEPVVVYHSTVLEKGKDYVWLPMPDDAEYREPGEYEIALSGESDRYRGFAVKTFTIVYSEDAAKAMVEQAKEEIEAAKEAVQALSDNATVEEIKAAYNKLVEAQNALAEAQNELARTNEALLQDEKESLQEQIDELEKQVDNLTHDLAKASYIDISNYAVTMKTSFEYTGKDIEPVVSVKGLDPSDYTVEYYNNREIGTAEVVITGNKENKFKGTITIEFKITKKTNPLVVKGKTATVKKAKVKKKAQTLIVSKVIKFTRKGMGKLTYAKASGNKKITINKKTGKVTVKKGLKKGTYKIRVKVTAAGNATYNKVTKTVTFKIKVR